jgi:hypothetical protein
MNYVLNLFEAAVQNELYLDFLAKFQFKMNYKRVLLRGAKNSAPGLVTF